LSRDLDESDTRIDKRSQPRQRDRVYPANKALGSREVEVPLRLLLVEHLKSLEVLLGGPSSCCISSMQKSPRRRPRERFCANSTMSPPAASRLSLGQTLEGAASGLDFTTGADELGQSRLGRSGSTA